MYLYCTVQPRLTRIKLVYFSSAGHFTQIVWKNTQDLGVGMAKNPRKTVIVATYYPRGNYVDMYKENVSKPKK